jgi:hypothetical protein
MDIGGGDCKGLDSVKLATGVGCSSPKDVIREVTRVYTER